VLFDGKRQKVLIKVVAIVAIISFAGFGLVAGGLAVSGGCAANDPLQQAIGSAQTSVDSAQAPFTAAQAAVAANPGNAGAARDLAAARSDLAQAQGNLASARVAADPNDPEALTIAQAAVTTAPGDYGAVQTLVAVATQQNNPSAALPALAGYTARNPRDAQAFADWGQIAEAAGQRNQAILAYQRFLVLAPDDTIAPDVRTRLRELTQAAQGGG
jgi:tetratricopeptide (TPR) repeat protein